MNKATWGALAVLAAVAVPAQAADVGVSVSVNQPGVYGRIDIGRVPSPPVLVYPQPVIIAQPAAVVQRQPIYLHVPPGHAKDWRKHCGKYNACGQPVYFVQESWYQQNYADGRGEGKQKHGKGHGKGHGKHDN